MVWLLHKGRVCPFIFNAGEGPLVAEKRADGPLMESSGLVDGSVHYSAVLPCR